MVAAEPVQFEALIEEAFEQLDYANLNLNGKKLKIEKCGKNYMNRERMKSLKQFKEIKYSKKFNKNEQKKEKKFTQQK